MNLVKRGSLTSVVLIISFSLKSQQIGNYINNGSFEDYFISGVIYKVPYYWMALDSAKPFGELLLSPSTVPLCSYTYQWPQHGKNHLISLQFCPTCGVHRGYPKNRMKYVLQSGKKYCVTFYVNLSNQATHGIDALGVYFGDNLLDTITKCNDPITYLIPQVQNQVNNIITDTLNWIKISGQFTANGTEKYMVIGNFESDANTNKQLVNPNNLPTNFADYLIDGVSVIEVDLPAYAGPDQVMVPGDSVFIGREPDFAIDSGCVWYQLPNMTTAIDTISGLWVKPTVTTTYVVRQILECSTEKWDTVVVYINPVGTLEWQVLNDELKIFPNPASNFVELQIGNKALLEKFNSVSIYNNLNQFIREEELDPENARIKVNDLNGGVYFLQLKNPQGQIVNKRFVISQ